jgi:hypothetical protein
MKEECLWSLENEKIKNKKWKKGKKQFWIFFLFADEASI